MAPCLFEVPMHHKTIYDCISHDQHKEFFRLVRSLYTYLFTAVGLLPGGSGYFTRKPNMKLVTTRFKSGGLHEKHVVATWNVGNHLSTCL